MTKLLGYVRGGRPGGRHSTGWARGASQVRGPATFATQRGGQRVYLQSGRARTGPASSARGRRLLILYATASLVAAAAGLVAPTVAAEPAATDPVVARASATPAAVTVRELVQVALSGNPEIAAARGQARGQRAAARAAGSLPPPSLSYTYLPLPVETRVGPNEHRLGVSQPIPAPWRLMAQRRQGRRRAAEAAARARLLEAATVAQVRVVAAELLYLQRAQALLIDSEALAQRLLALASERLAKGAGALFERSQARADLVQLGYDRRRFEDLRQTAAARLQALVGHAPLAAGLTVAPWALQDPALSLQEALDGARTASPQLALLDAGLTAHEAAVAVARSGYWPTLSLGAQLMINGPAVTAGAPGSGDDALGLTVGLTLPSGWGAQRAAVAAAEEGLGAAVHGRRGAEADLQVRVQETWNQRTDALRLLALYDDALLPQVRGALVQTEALVAAAGAGLSELLEVRATLLRFSLARARAWSDAAAAEARLDLLAGRTPTLAERERSGDEATARPSPPRHEPQSAAPATGLATSEDKVSPRPPLTFLPVLAQALRDIPTAPPGPGESAAGASPVTLSQAQALALFAQRSPALQAAWRRRRGADQRSPQVRELQRLAASADALQRRPDQRPAAWPLPGPSGLMGDAVEAEIDLAQVAFQAAVLDAWVELTRAFHEQHLAGREVVVFKESAALAAANVKVTRGRYAAGAAPRAELLRAEMDASSQRARASSAVERASAAARRLAATLDLAAPVVAGVPDALSAPPTSATVLASAVEALAVRRAALELRRAQALRRLLARRTVPELSPGLSERRGQDAPPAFVSGYSAAAPWLAELDHGVAAQQHALQAARVQATAQLEAAWTRLSDAHRRVRLAQQELLPRSRRLLDAARADYRVGRRGYADLDASRQLWLDTELQLARARRDAHVGLAELTRLLGRPLGAPAGAPRASETP